MSALAVPDASTLAAAGDPSDMVLALVEQGRSMIAQARTIEEHVMVHQRANAISVLTKQLGLSKELVLEAQELERHTERALVLAKRQAQERGELVTKSTAHLFRAHDASNRSHQFDATPKTLEEAGLSADLIHEAGPMADAEPESFEEAITEAKAEGNLSRANVIRKIKGETATKTDRHELLRRTRRLDSNRIVQGTVDSVHGIDLMFPQIDYSALDPDLIEGWVSSLTDAIRSLTTHKNNLKKELTRERQ